MTNKGRGAVAAVAALAVGLSTACAKPPDPDGEPMGATALELGVLHEDSLDCSGMGDCRDWFRVTAPGAGTLKVDAARGADAPAEVTPDFAVQIVDASGRVLGSSENAGRDRLRVSAAVLPGPLDVSIGLSDAVGGLLLYELRVSFQPKPRPAPRFDTVTSLVLEVERRPDGSRAVLIDKGRKAGIGRGNRGKLVESGRKIAEIEILDVYDDGSRALIRGRLESPITPETVVEVQVPR